MSNWLLQFFKYSHLKPEYQYTSKLFADVAHEIEQTLPMNPEKDECMRKLLEAKDCAVRCKLAGYHNAQN